MAYFRCTTGGSGKGNTLVVTCADDLAGATITCTNGTKTYRKTCPSTAPYEVTFYGLEAGTWTVSTTVSGSTYTTTVVITDYEAELGGFNWNTWVDLSQNYTSSDFTDLDDLLSDETAVRELMTIHDCVDYLAGIAAESADVETIIGNDLCAKWINLRDYALDTLYANEIIAGYMDTADKYGYGEWALMPQVPTMTSNTAPYGTAYASSTASSSNAYLAFDGDGSTLWNANAITSNGYIQYTFPRPVCVKRVYLNFGTPNRVRTFKIQAFNEGESAVDITDVITHDTSSVTQTVELDNNDSYTTWRVYVLTAETNISIYTVQFYAWAPKGNVPIMTANNAPYGSVLVSSALYSGSVGYSAFDGNDSSMTISAVNASTFYLGYKFVNPVKVARLKLYVGDGSATQYGQYAYSFNVQASNDGSNWSLLKSVSGTDGSEIIVDIPSEEQDYYLYYRLSEIKHKNNVANVSMYFNYIGTLQFYGRELKVSVPTMTGNTTPYGEASADSTGSTYYPWKAFNNSVSDGTYAWSSSNASCPHWLAYLFNKPTVVKFFYLRNRNNSSNCYAPLTFKIQGSNDGFVSDIHDITDVITSKNTAVNGISYYPITNNSPYKAYRIYVVTSGSATTATPSNTTTIIQELQFFGLDYSEREFEEGTTKKWLYDHGVELETVQEYLSNGTITKNADQIDIIGASSGVDATGIFYSVDFTQFNHAFARCGNVYLNATYEAFSIGSTIGGTPQASARPIPLPLAYLDVSSINATYNVYYSTASNGKCSLKELWLE